jgi:hypothetical protein
VKPYMANGRRARLRNERVLERLNEGPASLVELHATVRQHVKPTWMSSLLDTLGALMRNGVVARDGGVYRLLTGERTRR